MEPGRSTEAGFQLVSERLRRDRRWILAISVGTPLLAIGYAWLLLAGYSWGELTVGILAWAMMSAALIAGTLFCGLWVRWADVAAMNPKVGPKGLSFRRGSEKITVPWREVRNIQVRSAQIIVEGWDERVTLPFLEWHSIRSLCLWRTTAFRSTGPSKLRPESFFVGPRWKVGVGVLIAIGVAVALVISIFAVSAEGSIPEKVREVGLLGGILLIPLVLVGCYSWRGRHRLRVSQLGVEVDDAPPGEGAILRWERIINISMGGGFGATVALILRTVEGRRITVAWVLEPEAEALIGQWSAALAQLYNEGEPTRDERAN